MGLIKPLGKYSVQRTTRERGRWPEGHHELSVGFDSSSPRPAVEVDL